MKSLKPITTASLNVVIAGVVLSAFAATANANNDGAGHNWVPSQPTNNYWQAPSWSGFNNSPGFNSPRFSSNNMPPTYNSAPQQRPVQPNQNPQGQYNNYRAPNAYRGNPPPQNYRAYPPQRGPNPNMPPNMRPNYGPDNGISAYNMPGYNRNRNNSGWNNNNGWNNNKFWGRSGPSQWMNPNKGNMEQGWDDMINAPSRMGDMPGGWSAPEVTMPNPIDMGDQFQDNVQELPDQMRQGQIGNNVTN